MFLILYILHKYLVKNHVMLAGNFDGENECFLGKFDLEKLVRNVCGGNCKCAGWKIVSVLVRKYKCVVENCECVVLIAILECPIFKAFRAVNTPTHG